MRTASGKLTKGASDILNNTRRREREAVERIETNGTERDGKVSGANSVESFIDKLATQNPG